jgi:hypothetical protein
VSATFLGCSQGARNCAAQKKNKLTKSPISHGGNRENTQKKKVTEGDYTVTSRILGSIKNVKFSGEKVEVHTWMAEAKDRHPK